MFIFSVFLLLISVIKAEKGYLETVKTKYTCPQDFQSIGKKCYYFSKNEASWHDSHFHCVALNSTLSIVNTRAELNLLRNYLNKSVTDLGKYERWIDGIYDFKQSVWKWGSSGDKIKINKFTKLQTGHRFNWHCIILNPSKQNRWSARKCTDNRRFVCEKEALAIELKLLNKRAKKFKIAKCSNLDWLPKYQQRKCLELLGALHPNEPEYIVHKTKPTNPTTLDSDGFVCPPHMIGLGNKCYSFSKDPLIFKDAYFACHRNKSNLAMVRNRKQDLALRILLNGFIEKHDRWIGGVYDWNSNQWKWAVTGKPLKYKGFIKNILKNRSSKSLEWNAIYMDPSSNNSWNVDKETQKKHYICQVKAKAVKKLGGNVKTSQATITIVSQQG